jgi:hypothetical protein
MAGGCGPSLKFGVFDHLDDAGTDLSRNTRTVLFSQKLVTELVSTPTTWPSITRHPT